MAIKDEIMAQAGSDPSVAKAVQTIEAQLQNAPIVPEDMDEAIQLLEFVLQHPEKYDEVRAAAIADGIVDERMIPLQFDQVFIVSMLIALYSLQDKTSEKMACGGLAVAARKLATRGQGGDTELVHVNHREKEMLRRAGGQGSVNPNTGLHEYKSVGKILGTVLPVALSIIAPGVGTAIGSALGAGAGLGASALGSAVIGGASSALSGGNIAQGALMGGVSGGLGKIAGNAVNSQLGLGLGDRAQAILGGGIIGAGGNALTGGNAAQGLGQGALAGALSRTSMPKASESVLSNLRADAQPSSAPQGMLFSKDPLGVGSQTLSSDMPASLVSYSANPVTGLQTPVTTNPITGANTPLSGASVTPAQTNSSGVLGKIALGALALSSLSSAPQEVQTAVSTLTPAQQEYFNRPSVTWDWNKLQTDAKTSGSDLSGYLAKSWNRVQAGEYNSAPAAMAQGGLSRFAQGSGSGREDTIPARLSDGEYVFDAETVAMLGDGSSKAGAHKLDRMREEVRKQKGRALAKGKISPNAKSPLAYLKETA